MKKIILVILCIFLSLFLFSKVKTYKTKHINSLIEQTIEIAPYDYKGDIYFSQNVKKQPKGGALEDLIKYNSYYIQYFLKSYVDNKEFKVLKSLMKNKKKLNKKFIEIILRNKKFTNSYRYFISSYLVSKGAKVKGFKKHKREVSTLRALNTLSKFFYIHVYKKETGYRGHICIGINGIEGTSLKRDIPLEAFCFNTVFSNIKTSAAFFLDTSKAISDLELGSDKEKAILRAQGAMYYEAFKNPSLLEILKKEYQKRKSYLPFTIKGM